MEKRAIKKHKFPPADREFYQEEPNATIALLSVEKFIGAIHDPACGGGNIVKTCAAAGLAATGSDIKLRQGMPPELYLGDQDFLATTKSPAPNIITNPPFYKGDGIEDFIWHSLWLPDCYKLAVFANASFAGGETRAKGLWKKHPPDRIYFICPRISAPAGEYILQGGKVGGGQMDAMWFVWDKTHPYNGTHYGWALHDGAGGPKKKPRTSYNPKLL